MARAAARIWCNTSLQVPEETRGITDDLEQGSLRLGREAWGEEACRGKETAARSPLGDEEYMEGLGVASIGAKIDTLRLLF